MNLMPLRLRLLLIDRRGPTHPPNQEHRLQPRAIQSEKAGALLAPETRAMEQAPQRSNIRGLTNLRHVVYQTDGPRNYGTKQAAQLLVAHRGQMAIHLCEFAATGTSLFRPKPAILHPHGIRRHQTMK